MRLVSNTGNDRVGDILTASGAEADRIDAASSNLSLFALNELREGLDTLQELRLLIPSDSLNQLHGADTERHHRNKLIARSLAQLCEEWLTKITQVKLSSENLPQSSYSVKSSDGEVKLALAGNCPLTLAGLGIVPGSRLSLIQCAEGEDESEELSSWLEGVWNSLPEDEEAMECLLNALKVFSKPRAASFVYHVILFHLFNDLNGELDEEKIIKSATGIKNTIVWNKLYKFQRDGVVGAIDKMERYGGCIIADSVGLGKTFEALAIIKYYELRNDRVLVLCPKRLRDNWTVYATNDKRNILAADRFNFDVLNHTDLSRDKGMSGDIDLSYINWGNYDLVVIDESHNFRNKASRNDKETRYDRLMSRIIKSGVKTRVLMLSATPVNNRLSDLKNQLAFITEGEDDAMADSQIYSIESTIQKAQRQFNRWLELEEDDRSPSRLMDMLGFDYFKLLDLLTIARSRKHIQRYYGTEETGDFPVRLPPINIKSNVDTVGAFPCIRDINNEIRRLNLSVYAT